LGETKAFIYFDIASTHTLRSCVPTFVQHEGKKELVVKAMGTRYTVDFGYLATLMTGEIHKNVC
jgi:hypothetical protein